MFLKIDKYIQIITFAENIKLLNGEAFKYFWVWEKTTKTKKQYKIIANYVFAKDTFLYVLNNGNQESIVFSEINIKLQIKVISIFEF